MVELSFSFFDMRGKFPVKFQLASEKIADCLLFGSMGHDGNFLILSSDLEDTIIDAVARVIFYECCGAVRGALRCPLCALRHPVGL